MLIATWNVNSIRSRLNLVEEFLEKANPDLLCIQETKVEDEIFPKKSFLENGYHLSFYGQKSYNGVALISKEHLADVRFGFSGELVDDKSHNAMDKQKRVISALIDGLRVVNVYVPNGSDLESDKYKYKIEWLKTLHKYLTHQATRNEPICLLGDFNIALEDIDIHNPEKAKESIMASDLERKTLRKLLKDLSLEDIFRIFEQDTNHWSWWDYRHSAWERNNGWRIDHIYLGPELLMNAKSCKIHQEMRGQEKPSDHAPVMVEINWPPQIEEDF